MESKAINKQVGAKAPLPATTWSRGFSHKQDKEKTTARSRGFSPAKQDKIKTRFPHYKHLPHRDIKNHYQFITFRTHDSVDAYLKKLSQKNLPNQKKQLKIDEYLDQSRAGSYLNQDVLLLLYNLIKKHDRRLYELIAFCIMPNHVHLLMKPLYELDEVMRRLKGGSARMMNQMLSREGRFWAADYYDKLIRDEKHFAVVYAYIKNNPAVLAEDKTLFPRFYSVYEGL